MHVWTSISTAEQFPKKTADKNIIWIFSEGFQLYKNFKNFGNRKGLNLLPHASFPLKEKLPFFFNMLCKLESFGQRLDRESFSLLEFHIY